MNDFLAVAAAAAVAWFVVKWLLLLVALPFVGGRVGRVGGGAGGDVGVDRGGGGWRAWRGRGWW